MSISWKKIMQSEGAKRTYAYIFRPQVIFIKINIQKSVAEINGHKSPERNGASKLKVHNSNNWFL